MVISFGLVSVACGRLRSFDAAPASKVVSFNLCGGLLLSVAFFDLLREIAADSFDLCPISVLLPTPESWGDFDFGGELLRSGQRRGFLFAVLMSVSLQSVDLLAP